MGANPRGFGSVLAAAWGLTGGSPPLPADIPLPSRLPRGQTFLEELVEDLIWVEGGPERLRGRDVA